MGTFSDMAGRALAGPDSGIVSELQSLKTVMQQVADNTGEDEG